MVRYKPKKPVTVPPFLSVVIQPILQASTVAQLSEALETFDAPNQFEKPEERSLLNWYEILNRFDELMESYVKQHDILSAIPKAISGGNPYDSGATSIIGSTRGGATLTFNGGRIRPQDSLRLPSALSSALRSRNSERQSNQGATSPKGSDGSSSPRLSTQPLSAGLIVLILKATFRVVRNASHDTKNIYNSYDHILTLLGDPDPAIAILSLEILHALLMRSPKNRSFRPVNATGVTDRLRDIALGWGGREKALGLIDICSSLKAASLPEEGHSIQIEFKHPNKSKSEKNGDVPMLAQPPPEGTAKEIQSGDTPNVSLTVVGEVTRITVRDVRKLPGDEKWLVTDFVSKYKIPKNKIFSMLAAYRRAKAFGEGRSPRLGIVCQQLIALTTLTQLYPQPKALTDILQKEQELIHDIITLAKADVAYGLNDLPKSLRTLAVRCLAAMTTERNRLNAIQQAAGIGSHHGVFSSLLRSEIAVLLGQSQATPPGSNSNTRPGDGHERMDTDTTVSVPAVSVISADSENAGSDTDAAKTDDLMDVRMAEALLQLVLNIATHGGSSGAQNLVASGVLGIIIPLLRDREPSHSRAVSQGIRAINEIIQAAHSSVGSQAFRDHDGLNILAERIALETLGDINAVDKMSQKEREEEDEKVERSALKARGESRKMYEELLEQPMTIARALAHPAPSSSAASRGLLPHSKWTLLRVLHQLFLHALGGGGSPVRELISNSALPFALRQILARPFYYGGGLFASATHVATTIAHSEPAGTSGLVKAGIAKAIVRSISVGLPPHGDALKVIPNALAAICLASDARPDIVRASPLRPYVLRMATPFYSRALHGDAPSAIGGALDEMMRHVEALRELGDSALIDFLKTAAAFVELDISSLRDTAKGSENTSPSAKSLSSNGTAKKATGNTSSEKAKSEKSGSDSTPSDFVLMERMKLAVAYTAASLVGFSQGSSEHQTSIVTGKGLQEILKLRVAPALASQRAFTKDSHPSFRCSPNPSKCIASLSNSLKSFASRHASEVLSSLFSAVREDAGKVLRLAAKLGDAWLPEEEDWKDNVATNSHGGSSKRQNAGKDGSSRKRSRTQSSLAETPATGNTDSKKESSGPETRSRKSSKQSKDINFIRADLKNALTILRVDVVLLSNMTRAGSNWLAAAWNTQDGASIVSLIATIERLARYHLAVVYSGLSCSTSGESDLCSATVTASKLPAMIPMQPERIVDEYQDIANQMGIGFVKSSEISSACKSFLILPEKESEPRQDVKGLAWAMETLAYASQKLYMQVARGLIFSSRRAHRDLSRHAAAIRGLAATIGNVFVLHLKAAEPLWSRSVMTIGDGKVCAAWDYIRRILAEMKSTLFCESNRNTQGLILRFFLAAGGAEALCKACRPLSLLKGSRTELDTDDVKNPEAYVLNKKRFESFLKSSKLGAIYTTLLLAKVEKTKKKSRSGSGQSSDTAMSIAGGETAEIAEFLRNIRSKKITEKQVEELEQQVSIISSNVLHHRKQAAIQKTAGNAWATLCNLLHFFSNCPALLSSSPTSMPSDPDAIGISEWQGKDVLRSAQYISMKMLMDVTKEPTELLSALKPSGSHTSDVVSVILSILRTSHELTAPSDSYSTDHRPDSEDMDRQTTTDEPPPPNPINPEHVQHLVEMGYTEARARQSLRCALPPGGVQHAVEWLSNNPEVESDDSSDEGDDEEDNEISDLDVEEIPSEDAEMADAEQSQSDVADESAAMSGVEPVGDTTVGDDPVATTTEPEELMPDLVSDDSLQPISSERDNGNDSKSRDNQLEVMFVDKDSEQLLRSSLSADVDEVSAVISGIKSISKQERSSILAMISGVVSLQPSKSTQIKKGNDRQRILSRARAVSIDSYKTSKKNLFDSLIPVAMTAIKHEMEHGSSSHASFVAVEILSILQKDKRLTPEIRLEFAKVITDELEKFVSSPRSAVKGINNIVGIRVSFVWAHYGGSQARQALKASGVADIAFRTLMEMGSSWESLEGTDAVDEEATKPIRHLTINERTQVESEVANAEVGAVDIDDSEKCGLTVPRKPQLQALNCLTTCLLVLDAFVRFHERDSIVEHVVSKRKQKDTNDSNAMDVDAPGVDVDTSPDAEVSAVFDTIVQSMNSSGAESRMEVDESPIPEDLDEFSNKVKQQAEVERKKVTEKVVDELLDMVGSKTRGTPLSFSTSDLLRCCMKLMSSFNKYEVGDCLLALLQLLCSLTADMTLAKQFMEDGGVEILINLPHLETNRSKTSNTRMVRSLVRTIIRHVVEDEKTLTEAMESEVRSLLQSTQTRPRQMMSVRSLVNTCSGMISRNLECFTRALASSARARSPNSSSESGLQVTEHEPHSFEYWQKEAKQRQNVVCVVEHLAQLLANRAEPPDESVANKHSSKMDMSSMRRGLGSFALSLLSDLVQLCPVVAAQFLQVASPVKELDALDFVVRKVLPVPDTPSISVTDFVNDSLSSMQAAYSEQENMSESARSLVLALLSKTANAHKPTVKALAEAARIESERSSARGGVLKAISLCIVPNSKMRVLREMLESQVANYLAKSLDRLDMSREGSHEVANSVLKALTILGQTAQEVSRRGNNADDDAVVTHSREMWSPLRDRESPLAASGYMVI